MAELAEWLLSCIHDDAQIAAAAADAGLAWTVAYDGDTYRDVTDGGSGETLVTATAERPTVEQAKHIARHDPASVLADCEAKRRIVEMHSRVHECPAVDGTIWFEFSEADVAQNPCDTLRFVGLAFAGRDGYREDWRP